MRVSILFILVLYFGSCVPNMNPGKSILKQLKTTDAEIEWFTYGSSYVNTPEYITVSKQSNVDTIAWATNIGDINVDEKIITIGFYGRPMIYQISLTLPTEVNGYKVMVDTGLVRKP